jgi:hypothetical protein
MAVTEDLHDQKHQKHGLVDQKCFDRSESTEHGLDCLQQIYDISREGGSRVAARLFAVSLLRQRVRIVS